MARTLRRRWYALLVPLLAIAAVAAAIAPGAASAAAQTGTVAGTLKDTTGATIVGATVQVQDSGDDEIASAKTTAGGAFSIPGVPVGTYDIYLDVSAETNSAGLNYVNQWYGTTPGAVNALNQADATAVTVSSGQTTTLTTTVTTGGVLSGSVTDAATNGALDSGYVYLYDSDGDEISQQLLTTSNAYKFTGLATGTYYLQSYGYDTANNYEWDFMSSGDPVNDANGYYTSSGLAATTQQATPISVTAGGSSSTANLALPAATSITGSVNEGGNPVGDVEVYLYDSSNNYTDYEAGTIASPTDAAYGQYTIDHLVPGAYKVEFLPNKFDESNTSGNLAFQFWNDATTLAAATTVSPTVASPSTQVNATLNVGGDISGTVTDAATGKPLADAEIELLDASGNYEADAYTDADGTYTLDGIPSGSWYLQFSEYPDDASAYQTQYYGGKQVLAGSTPVTVTAGQTTSGINAALGPISTPGQTTTVVSTQTVPAAIPTIASTAPTITGTAKVGSTLTSQTTGWTAGTSYRYQWYAGGVAIAGATASTYTLTAGQYKKAITVTVIGSLSGYYSATVSSAATKAVAAGTLAAKVPTITGTKRVGDKLTAKPGVWTAGTKFTYQWYANGKAIRGATKSTFKLAGAEKGKKITVKVTGRLTGYTTVAKSSRATAKIG